MGTLRSVLLLSRRPSPIGIWEPEHLDGRRGSRLGWTPAPCRSWGSGVETQDEEAGGEAVEETCSAQVLEGPR